MTTVRTRLHKDTYRDSILLLRAATAMQNAEAVSWGTAVMATPANVDDLATEGVSGDDLVGANANDLVLAVRADTVDAADAALDSGEDTLFAKDSAGEEEQPSQPSRTVEQAVARNPSANLALVSVPGDYAALEAHKALTAGLHVLLFSDNVPIEEEVELKERAGALGLLVMGAGAGTAMLGGAGLGFANAVDRGRVGVVAAAGTGAQEVMVLLNHWGAGVSHVIGVGGRDLTREVGGRMARPAVRALDADPRTEVILLVSKPPDSAVARTVAAERRYTPMVAALIGLSEQADQLPGVEHTTTLEQGAARAAATLGTHPPDLTASLARQAATALEGLPATRTAIRGYFSGGTLCSETQVVLTRHLGPVHSNIPMRGDYGMPAPAGAHVCLDLGEEEYTQGRPHPMIDPSTRIEMLRRQAKDPEVAVVLLDVVLGYGAHSDPAGALAPACAELTANGDGPRVIAYVLGSERDPQESLTQRETLRDAGCIIAPSGARAAHLAAAVAARRPELAEVIP